MTGPVIFVWHDENDTYDEVRQLPEGTTEEIARGIALLKMSLDNRATHIHIELAAA